MRLAKCLVFVSLSALVGGCPTNPSPDQGHGSGVAAGTFRGEGVLRTRTLVNGVAQSEQTESVTMYAMFNAAGQLADLESGRPVAVGDRTTTDNGGVVTTTEVKAIVSTYDSVVWSGTVQADVGGTAFHGEFQALLKLTSDGTVEAYEEMILGNEDTLGVLRQIIRTREGLLAR